MGLSAGSYIFTGSVSGYSRTVSINKSTTDVYVMPEGALYWYGNECSDITGGWSADGYNLNSSSYPNGLITPTKNTNNFYLPSGTWKQSIIGTVNTINTINYNRIKFIVTSNNDQPHLGVVSAKITAEDGARTMTGTTTNGVFELDLSSYQGNYYPYFRNSNGRGEADGYAYAVWLE